MQTLIANLEKVIDSWLEKNLLNSQKKTVKEYDLLQACENEACFQALRSASPSLMLFQKHFLCMHVLYKLQKQWLERKYYLNISSINISLEQQLDNDDSLPGTDHNELANYYLNLENLTKANEDSVHQLQENFFKQYHAWLNADEAYATLGISPTSSWEAIQKEYRRLCQLHHPDKGGDSEIFLEMQYAYEQLKTRYLKT